MQNVYRGCRCAGLSSVSLPMQLLMLEQEELSVCVNKRKCPCLVTGFVHFFRPKIQGLFKDFQGPKFEISRTSFLFTSKNLPMEID